MKQRRMWQESRISYEEQMQLTIDSLATHGPRHSTWVIAWSGGKDSTALLTFVLHVLGAGLVKKPERLIVCYADTRMELPPLAHVARTIIDRLKRDGIEIREVCAELDKRYFVYMLGRGVPPPNNNTLRWCTRQIKIDPMAREVRRLMESDGSQALMLTGVREGESAIRDGRIAMSCSADGAECGQGWYQRMSGERLATLAPLLHWRVCGVWDWLRVFAPMERYGGWETQMLADAYGGDEATEMNARTGCNGCPLASKDTALDYCLTLPQWSHLSPLKELRPLYRKLREPGMRLRKLAGECRKDGSLVDNQCRMGPLTLQAREWALGQVLDIQARCNADASRPRVDMLNAQEQERIRELIEAKTFPQRWTGDEPLGSESFLEPGLSLFDWGRGNEGDP